MQIIQNAIIFIYSAYLFNLYFTWGDRDDIWTDGRVGGYGYLVFVKVVNSEITTLIGILRIHIVSNSNLQFVGTFDVNHRMLTFNSNSIKH